MFYSVFSEVQAQTEIDVTEFSARNLLLAFMISKTKKNFTLTEEQ